MLREVHRTRERDGELWLAPGRVDRRGHGVLRVQRLLDDIRGQVTAADPVGGVGQFLDFGYEVDQLFGNLERGPIADGQGLSAAVALTRVDELEGQLPDEVQGFAAADFALQ